jgi:type VI protein secretion system component VasK
MDHLFVEQNDVVSRYLRRRLTTGEVQDFEGHFVDCPDCQDAIEHESDLQGAFKRLLPAAFPAPRRYRHVAEWLAAAAVLALAAYGTATYLQTRRALVDASSRVRALEQQVAEARARADTPAAVAIFELIDTDVTRSTRGAGDATAVAVPSSASLVVLSLQVQNADAYRRFRAEVFRTASAGSDGSSVWKGDPLFQSSPSSVGIAVPPAVLRPGSYYVTLAGVTSDGRSLDVGRFPFRVAIR